MNNKKYYLIANLARSYDGNDKIHLVSSVYYSENIIIKAVKSFKQIIYIYKDYDVVGLHLDCRSLV